VEVIHYFFEAVWVDGIHLMGSEFGQLWGSWDGEHWIKLFDAGGEAQGERGIGSISTRRPIYFVEKIQGKLYRLEIQKEDLVRLYYQEYYNWKGTVTNATNFILEQRVWNGTNYIDLTGFGLSNVQASIKGLTRYNWFDNAGFETGDKTGWDGEGSPYGVIRSDNPANGSYYYAKNHTTAPKFLYQEKWASFQEGDIAFASFYIKANRSETDAVGLYPTTDQGWGGGYMFDVTTSWERHVTYCIARSGMNKIRYWVRFNAFTDLESCVDSLVWGVLETGIHKGVSGEAVAYFEKGQYEYSRIPFTENDLNTTNPILTINGQQVSHSGSLTNGTESSPTSLTGILTGAVKVEADIEGSGQAILKINGTRILYEDSMVLRGIKQTVYYGRYYDTFTPNTTTNNLIVVTNLQANVTSLTYTGKKLTFRIDSPAPTTSVTLVYCANMGEPRKVMGATSYSYNSTTKILTVNMNHSSETEIERARTRKRHTVRCMWGRWSIRTTKNDN